MGWLIFGILFIIAGLVVPVFWFKQWRKLIIGGGVAVGLIMILASTIYTQEVGEALIIKNADGTVSRVDIEPGLGFKAPWQDTLAWDVKGQQIVYKGDGKATQDNEKVDGPEITVSAKDNLSSQVDVAVRYSLDPNSIEKLYNVYKTEQVFKDRLITKDSQTVIRDSANAFTTNELKSNRAAYSAAIEKGLKDRWENEGVIVDSLALQDIRVPASVSERYEATLKAEQEVIKEQATTKVIEEQARQKVIEAKGVSDANNILNGSLTDKVLQDKYIEALKNADSLVVVPEGSTPMISVPKSEVAPAK